MESCEAFQSLLEREPHKLNEILLGIFDHIEELNKRIEEQNKQIALLVSQLEEKETRIRKLEEENQQLNAENLRLKEENQKLREENQELRNRLGMNSKNSSKPPSTDVYNKPVRKKKPSNKRVGGQKGHKGSTRDLSDHPDEIKILEARVCGCGRSLEKEKVVGYERRQVWDIPPPKYIITEYRSEKKKCPHCHTVHTAPFPQGVNTRMKYGPNIRATAVYWGQYQMVPLKRLSQSFKDLNDLDIPESTLVNCFKELSELSNPFYEEVRKEIIRSEVAGFDETSMSNNGKLKWLHTAVNERLSFFSIQENRGKKGIDQAGVLPEFQGTAVHDGWKPYCSYPNVLHSLCHAHLLRDLEGIIETTDQPWAHEMKAHLLEMNAIRNAYMDKRQKIPKRQAEELTKRYKEILETGFEANPEPQKPPNQKGNPKRSPALNLLRRLEKDEEAVLAFLRNPKIPFTNNDAERSFRMAKVKEKVSGGFRGRGDEWFAIIRTLIETLKKTGCSVFDIISLLFQGYELAPQ